jgi:hypothetical protein
VIGLVVCRLLQRLLTQAFLKAQELLVTGEAIAEITNIKAS